MFTTARDISERKQAEEALSIQGRIATIFATSIYDDVFDEVLALVLLGCCRALLVFLAILINQVIWSYLR